MVITVPPEQRARVTVPGALVTMLVMTVLRDLHPRAVPLAPEQLGQLPPVLTTTPDWLPTYAYV